MSSDVEAATAATNRRSQPGRAREPRLSVDPAVVEEEHRRIFERTRLAGHVADLPERGTYTTTNVGDQPTFVVRDHDDVMRAFRNVCRHRASCLLTGSGSCGKAIGCRHHGWTYRLDGSLIGVPEGRDVAGLDKSRLGLHQARVEVFCGLAFVNLDPGASPPAEQLAGLQERLAPYRLPEPRRFGKGSGGGTQPANWKIVVENHAEGYRIPSAHPSLMRLLGYQRYTVEVRDNCVWFNEPVRDKPSDNRLERAYQRLVQPMPGLRPEDHLVGRFVVIYPNTTIGLYRDQVNTWRLWPTARRPRSTSGARSGAPAAGHVAQRINDLLDTTNLKDDVDLVQNVQRGMAKRDRQPGRSRSARRPWPGSRTASAPTWRGR